MKHMQHFPYHYLVTHSESAISCLSQASRCDSWRLASRKILVVSQASLCAIVVYSITSTSSLLVCRLEKKERSVKLVFLARCFPLPAEFYIEAFDIKNSGLLCTLVTGTFALGRHASSHRTLPLEDGFTLYEDY